MTPARPPAPAPFPCFSLPSFLLPDPSLIRSCVPFLFFLLSLARSGRRVVSSVCSIVANCIIVSVLHARLTLDISCRILVTWAAQPHGNDEAVEQRLGRSSLHSEVVSFLSLHAPLRSTSLDGRRSLHVSVESAPRNLRHIRTYSTWRFWIRRRSSTNETPLKLRNYLFEKFQFLSSARARTARQGKPTGSRWSLVRLPQRLIVIRRGGRRRISASCARSLARAPLFVISGGNTFWVGRPAGLAVTRCPPR